MATGTPAPQSLKARLKNHRDKAVADLVVAAPACRGIRVRPGTAGFGRRRLSPYFGDPSADSDGAVVGPFGPLPDVYVSPGASVMTSRNCSIALARSGLGSRR